jgi:hypothetical protein
VLKASVLSAVRAAKIALQDLMVTASYVPRGEVTYVPGSAPSYPEGAAKTVKMALVQFDREEIDGGRVQYGDRKGIVLADDDLSSAKVGDKITVGSTSYVVVSPELYDVGGEVAAMQLHLRPA